MADMPVHVHLDTDERDDVAGVVGPIEPRRMPTLMSVRLDPGVAGELRDIANQRGCTVSDLLRRGAALAMNERNIMTITWTGGPTVVMGNTATFSAGPPPSTIAGVRAKAKELVEELVFTNMDAIRAEVAEEIAKAIEAHRIEYDWTPQAGASVEGAALSAAARQYAAIARGYTLPGQDPADRLEQG